MQSNTNKNNQSNNSFGKGPVGKGNYVVRQGDSVDSIAFKKGFFWETLWNLPENAQLKDSRKNPDALLPSDKVFIPRKREGEESAATEQTHRFRRKGVPIKIELAFFIGDDPIEETPYTLEIDGEFFTGTTDKGKIDHPISPAAKRGKLILGEGDSAIEYKLKVGHIDSIEELSGIQGRLNNLGYYCGRANGEMNQQTIDAIKYFQEQNNLQNTRELNQETVDTIEEQYGS